MLQRAVRCLAAVQQDERHICKSHFCREFWCHCWDWLTHSISFLYWNAGTESFLIILPMQDVICLIIPPHIRPAKFTPVIIISYNNEQTIYFYYSTQLIVYYNWIRNSIQFYLAPWIQTPIEHTANVRSQLSAVDCGLDPVLLRYIAIQLNSSKQICISSS